MVETEYFLDKVSQQDDHSPVRPFQLVRLLDVLKFYAHEFVDLMGLLGKLEGTCDRAPNPDQPVGHSREIVCERLNEVKTLCEQVGLKLSALRIETSSIFKPDIEFTFKQLGQMLVDVRYRVKDELSLCLLLQVPNERHDAYENPDAFGAKVAAKFGAASYDVGEASKCLALDRGTACVMHLMRVLEPAIDAIALGVGVPVTAVKAVGTWEQLLNMIRDKIKANNQASAPPWIAARSFFESALAYLHAVKDAWRNPAMHAEQKYTPEEADRIYSAVKNLMTHLSEHLDENGVFTP